jgi:hypothetical protein
MKASNVNPAAVLRTSCTERQRPLRQAGDVLVVTRLERLARSTRDVLAPLLLTPLSQKGLFALNICTAPPRAEA